MKIKTVEDLCSIIATDGCLAKGSFVMKALARMHETGRSGRTFKEIVSDYVQDRYKVSADMSKQAVEFFNIN